MRRRLTGLLVIGIRLMALAAMSGRIATLLLITLCGREREQSLASDKADPRSHALSRRAARTHQRIDSPRSGAAWESPRRTGQSIRT